MIGLNNSQLFAGNNSARPAFKRGYISTTKNGLLTIASDKLIEGGLTRRLSTALKNLDGFNVNFKPAVTENLKVFEVASEKAGGVRIAPTKLEEFDYCDPTHKIIHVAKRAGTNTVLHVGATKFTEPLKVFMEKITVSSKGDVRRSMRTIKPETPKQRELAQAIRRKIEQIKHVFTENENKQFKKLREKD